MIGGDLVVMAVCTLTKWCILRGVGTFLIVMLERTVDYGS